MGRKSKVAAPAKAEALAMDEEFQSTSRLWARIRKRFPRAVTEFVDVVAELGGLSLHDIELLQCAQLERLEQRIRRLEKRPKTSTAVSKMESLKLQGMKHLRTLRLAQAPISTPNDQKHPEPEELELRRQAKERLAAHMRAGPQPVDTGIDLN